MKDMDNCMLVDLGNSSLQWTRVVGDTLELRNRFHHGNKPLTEKLNKAWGHLKPPKAVWLAAVANQEIQDDLKYWIEQQWSVPMHIMRTEKSSLSVVCAYTKPTDLGVDRWAAILAGYHYQPQGVCVVDCGTAITLDAVRGDGLHLGGYILPGFELMEQCLLAGTAIGEVTDDGSEGAWGNSTASCIALGVRKSIISLVESSIERLQAVGVCDPALILTGGSAKEIAALIEMDHEMREQLVLEGLFLYARGKNP